MVDEVVGGAVDEVVDEVVDEGPQVVDVEDEVDEDDEVVITGSGVVELVPQVVGVSSGGSGISGGVKHGVKTEKFKFLGGGGLWCMSG